MWQQPVTRSTYKAYVTKKHIINIGAMCITIKIFLKTKNKTQFFQPGPTFKISFSVIFFYVFLFIEFILLLSDYYFTFLFLRIHLSPLLLLLLFSPHLDRSCHCVMSSCHLSFTFWIRVWMDNIYVTIKLITIWSQ